MKPRGKTREIIKLVDEIQTLVGNAKSLHDDDQNRDGHAMAQQQLEKAFEKCIQIRGMYDPI
ncbi:hypothetical protein [Brevibacillus reuszeri]|uniref:hypothetical protein n=1 Tax=Brevibacillus reuszeri TaxID=54915 RepID=UPI000CCBFED4|nr:hypothetical protein [Brevibacillus reuszeri]